jgi:histidine triad (HIT) family protein
MSLEQPTPYKVLVIPRDHVETVYDLTDEQAAAIFRATVRVARAVREASGCAGLNLVQANEPAAGQDVFHFHLHVVPRFAGDGIVLRWEHAVTDRAELDRLAAEIRARLR